MNKLKIVFFILLIPLGIFLFVYGESDDSPGAQALGLVLGIAGITGSVRMLKSK